MTQPNREEESSYRVLNWIHGAILSKQNEKLDYTKDLHTLTYLLSGAHGILMKLAKDALAEDEKN